MSTRAPRRTPTQKRSRETVDAILEATDRLLRDVGLSGLLMRDVARVAGVGMGTLYQYFATREALLAGWEERAFERIAQQIGEAIARVATESPPLDVAVFTLVTTSLDLVVRHMEAYPRVDADLFFSRTLERHEQQERAAEMITAGFGIVRSHERLRGHDRAAAARAAVKTIMYFARDLAHSPLAPDLRGALRRQVALMLVHMLVKDADEALLAALG